MPLEPQVVDATLQVEQPDTTLAPLAVGTDAASPTGVALPVLDAGTRSRLDAVQASLADVLAALGTVAGNTTGNATEATVAAILAAVDGVEALLGAIGTLLSSPTVLDATTIAALDNGLTDAQLRAAPVPVSATDLDIRNLDDSTDTVRSVDAAEDANLSWQTIDFATSGAHTIVSVAPGLRLRLRRFLPTGASVPDVTGDPILTISFGGHSLRTTILTGRFDILGADGEDLVITSSKAGQVDGSVAYTLELA